MSLTEELNNDPENIGYAIHIADGNHQEVANLINEPRYKTIGARRISSAELLIWGGEGRLAKLEDAANNNNLTAQVRSAANAAIKMILRDTTELDMSNAKIVGMIQALVDAGVFNSTDKTNLEDLSTENISRAEQLGFGYVTHQQIREAI